MSSPLADLIRPKKLDEVVGQKHLLGEGKPLRKIIDGGNIPNMIFYGPSGTGKTSVARIIAENTNMSLHKLNGTSASTADIKQVISEIGTFSGANGILLYLDEIQYLNKKQQQSLLEYMENGQITLIASTTENPYFAVFNAVISRSTVFEFKPPEKSEVKKAVERAFELLEEQNNSVYEIENGVSDFIAVSCGGDVRKAINTVELSALAGEPAENGVKIKLAAVEESVKDKRVVLVDDSIVRGNTMGRVVRLLRDAGAKEVHVRISSPPFLHPCYYGTDIDSEEHLIACKYSIPEICTLIGADSLGYLPVESLCALTGTHGFCSACFNGDYPTKIPTDTRKDRFEQRLSDRQKEV